MSYDKQINDQYKKWKRNVTFLYDLVLAHVLEWPSTSIQWTGKCDSTSKRDVIKHEVLFCSRCLDPKDTTINVAEVDIPNSDDSYEFWGKEEGPVVRENNRKSVVQKKFGIFHPVSDKVVVKKKIIMQDSVTRIAVMKQNSNIFACSTQKAESLFIFNHDTNTQCIKALSPDLTLSVTSAPVSENVVTGFDWNNKDAGIIVTFYNNNLSNIFDVTKPSEPTSVFGSCLNQSQNRMIFTDIKWHSFVHTFFATSSIDGSFQLWDLRSRDRDRPSSNVRAHTEATNSLSFSEFDETLLVTGSKDRSIALWDMRNLKVKIHSLTGHMHSVEKVSWCPDNGYVIASKDSERTINLWDLSKIGSSTSDTTAKSNDQLTITAYPPELLFAHRGHSSRISDFAWNPNESFMIGSVAEDNISQFWKPCSSVLSLVCST